jgi:quinoprotein glucose dehydrogenase
VERRQRGRSAGLVYLPWEPDAGHLGRQPHPAGERFNSAIVALDLATGKVRWVYQTVHHDLWDMDIGGQPTSSTSTRRAARCRR